MTAEAISALFDRRKVALAANDSMAIAADYTDDCVLESPIWGTLIGRAAVEKSYRKLFAAFRDPVYEFGEHLISGNQAVQTAFIKHGGHLYRIRVTGTTANTIRHAGLAQQREIIAHCLSHSR